MRVTLLWPPRCSIVISMGRAAPLCTSGALPSKGVISWNRWILDASLGPPDAVPGAETRAARRGKRWRS